jgi:hypothetical protein
MEPTVVQVGGCNSKQPRCAAGLRDGEIKPGSSMLMLMERDAIAHANMGLARPSNADKTETTRWTCSKKSDYYYQTIMASNMHDCVFPDNRSKN